MLHPETLNKSHGFDGPWVDDVTVSIVVVDGTVVVVVDVVVVGIEVVPWKTKCFFVEGFFQIGLLDDEVVTGTAVVVGVLEVDVTTVEYIKPWLVDGIMVVEVVVVVGDTTGGKEILCTVDDCASGNLAVATAIVTGVAVVASDMELETVV